MCKLIKLTLPEKSKLTGLYHALAGDELVGHLIGMNKNTWVFQPFRFNIEHLPQKLQQSDYEIFTSFKKAKIAITGEE